MRVLFIDVFVPDDVHYEPKTDAVLKKNPCSHLVSHLTALP